MYLGARALAIVYLEVRTLTVEYPEREFRYCVSRSERISYPASRSDSFNRSRIVVLLFCKHPCPLILTPSFTPKSKIR